MAKGSNVTEEQCEGRNSNVHQRINQLSNELANCKSAISNIRGGVAVVAFIAVLCLAGIMYHINYRFSSIEQSLKTINTNIEQIKKDKKL